MERTFKADIAKMTCLIDGEITCKMSKATYVGDRAKNNGHDFWVNLTPLNIDKKSLTIHDNKLEGTFEDSKINIKNSSTKSTRITLEKLQNALDETDNAILTSLIEKVKEKLEKDSKLSKIESKRAKLLKMLADLDGEVVCED